MYLTAKPGGVNAPSVDDRMPLWQVVNGDEWILTTRLMLSASTAATSDNSRVVFSLAETRFSSIPLWTGGWGTGITVVDTRNHPGLVSIRIPDAITATLRRGAYSFSITVADLFGRHKQTVLTGNVQVEYEPTSPLHNIPYRKDAP